VGNKIDLANNRAVPYEEAEAYANENELLFFEASAKTGTNIIEVFTELGKFSWRFYFEIEMKYHNINISFFFFFKKI